MNIKDYKIINLEASYNQNTNTINYKQVNFNNVNIQKDEQINFTNDN